MNALQPEQPRIVLLCGGGESSRIVFNALEQWANIERVLVESAPPRLKMLQRRFRRLGFVETLGQVMFMALVPFLARSSRSRRQELLLELNLDTSPIPETRLDRVATINSTDVQAVLQELRPDAVVVNGTRIIKPEILDCIEAPFVNTHVGITPRYRGVHGGYWALASGDPEHFGVTVHLVDPGIDTGGVLYQSTARTPTSDDNFATYPILQIAAGLPLIQQAVADIQAGGLNPTDGVDPSNLWYHPTLWQYLRCRWKEGIG